jgi:hypothetical protein
LHQREWSDERCWFLKSSYCHWWELLNRQYWICMNLASLGYQKVYCIGIFRSRNSIYNFYQICSAYCGFQNVFWLELVLFVALGKTSSILHVRYINNFTSASSKMLIWAPVYLVFYPCEYQTHIKVENLMSTGCIKSGLNWNGAKYNPEWTNVCQICIPGNVTFHIAWRFLALFKIALGIMLKSVMIHMLRWAGIILE